MGARSLIIQSYCTTLPCTILGVYRPPLEGTKFLAFELFQENFARMNITKHTVAPPPQALRAELATWCSMSVHEQAAVHGEEIGTPGGKIELSCWLGTWVYTLLVDGFGFSEDTRDIVLNARESEIDWTQGQAIYETSFFPYRLVKRQ